MGLLVWLLFDVAIEVVGELILEFTRLLNEDRSAAPVAVIWFVVLGLVVGAASCLVAADRVLRPGPFVGVSLVVVPVILGALMEVWGQKRTSSGHAISHLATWYGGAAMGFGLAGGRLGVLLLVREV